MAERSIGGLFESVKTMWSSLPSSVSPELPFRIDCRFISAHIRQIASLRMGRTMSKGAAAEL